MDPVVLLVDRNVSTRRSLARRLERIDCEILEAEGLSQAMEIVGRSEIQVALLSLGCLVEEAPILLRAIKRVRPDTAVILLAGPEHIHLSIQCMKLGAFDELPVPLDVDRLVSRVADALARAPHGGVRGSGPGADGGSPIDQQGE